jgi:hypothetical protein
VARRGFGSVVKSTPDPYAAVTDKAQELKDAMAADVFPKYNPRGIPPNGYAIGLAARQVKREDATGQRTPAWQVVRTNGIADPYSTALAARRSA